MALQPFNPEAEVTVFRNHLPHWRQPGVTYFVTTRLADSVPASTLRQWTEERRNWLSANGGDPAMDIETLPPLIRQEYHARFTKSFHEFLDAGAGACSLREPRAAEIVAGALKFYDGQRYVLGDFVVMPNHLHVLVTPAPDHELSAILHSWKRFTAREINKLLGQDGAFWQAESFNHIVRSEAQWLHFRQYIAENPVKARLRVGEYLLQVAEVK